MIGNSHYETLNISKQAPPHIIKAAFRATMRVVHPDGSEPDPIARIAVTEAYEILSDPVQRKRYDSQLEGESSFDSHDQDFDDEWGMEEEVDYRDPVSSKQSRPGQFVTRHNIAYGARTAGDELAACDAWDADFGRKEGPFDIEEVDLEADKVMRLDLGTLIVTPFDNMDLQPQVAKAEEKAHALLISDGATAMEVAVFDGPIRSSMVGMIREEIIVAITAAQGQVELVRGPFGTELRRRLPVITPEGQPATHLSRIWLCDGPGWVLRGVLMGKAALEPDNEEAEHYLRELFTNLVVRRGTEPVTPGSMLLMDIPRLNHP